MLWAASDVGVKTDLQLAEQSCASSGCAWLGFSSSPAPGFWRAGDPLSPLIRLGRGVIVGSGSSLEWPSHTEKSLISFVPEVNFFFLVKRWNRLELPSLEVFKKTCGLQN